MALTIKRAVNILNNHNGIIAEIIEVDKDKFESSYKLGDIKDYGCIKAEIVKLTYYPLAEIPCGTIRYKLKGVIKLEHVL